MTKLLLALCAVAALVAGVVWLVSQDGATSGTPREDRAAAAGDDAEQSADAKARAEHKPRAHAPEEKRTETLAVAGVVKSADGKPVAGAAVGAYAVPANDDVSDEDRALRELLTRSFGKPTADRLTGRTGKLRDAVRSRDAARMGEVMQDGMEIGMELMADEGGMDAVSALLRSNRDLAVTADADWPLAGSASTGPDGTFRIEGLAPGRVELRAKAPSFVKSKQRVDAGNVAVSIQLERGAPLAGVVTCDKEPVAGASVAIRGAMTTTGADGRFRFDAAHVPTETIVVSAENCCPQGDTVALSLDGPPKDVAIALEPAGSAAGHVSAIQGGPIAGARVTLGGTANLFADMMGMGGTGRFDVPPPPAVTDANGAFEIHGLRVGAVKLRVDADGYLGTSVGVDVKRAQTSPVEALLLRESVLVGTVRDAQGAPLAGAKVRVEVPSRDAATGMIASMMGGTFRSGVADENGRYEVHGLSEGERKVRVEAAKFLRLEDKVSIPAQAAATRDFTLRPGYKLAGTVAGPDGKAFGGAKVYASGKPPSGGAAAMAVAFGGARKEDAVAVSGADGKWSADGLPEGPYVVKASADGFLDGEVKDVEPGRTDVALTLGAAAAIKGRVIGVADGRPVAGATVQRRTPDASGARTGRGRGGRNPFAAFGGGGGQSATTDKDGLFEMKGLEPGEYELTGSMRGFADSEIVKITCDAGQTVDHVEISLPPGVSVTGTVVEKATGAPVAGAIVWAGRADTNPFAGMATSDASGGDPQAPPDSINTTTDAAGRFVLNGLPPGKVSLEVRVVDHAPASASGVEAPSTDVVVTVSGGGSVAGRVTGADGGPVAGSQLLLMRGMMAGGGPRQTKSDSNGDFLVDHVPAGTYQLMLMDPQNPMAPTMASVNVKDGETTRHDFTKKTGGRQFGGAATKDGKPLANAPIMLMGGSAGLKMTSTDDKGHFSFDGLDPGDYTVMVQSSFVNGGSTSRKVTVGSDGKVEDVNLQLSSEKVEGDVVDADSGKGIAGAQVVLTEPGAVAGSGADLIGAYRGQGITDEHGHFSINDVQAGTFTLKATAAEYPSATIDGVVAGTQDVVVKLRRGVEFPVTVRGPDGPVANASVVAKDASGNTSLVFDQAMSGFTRTDGVAHLRLTPGRYTLTISASDFLPATADADTSAGSATVQLDVGASIEVSVTDGTSPVAGARVKLLDASGAEIKPGVNIASLMGGGDRTDANGVFTRKGLPAGPATVVVTDAAGHDTTQDTTLETNAKRHVDVVIGK
jgi:protocatechuate 3,4-dioxygenase beta subunit